MTPGLLDRCLTDRRRMGRSALVSPKNQWFAMPLLLDRCLTGGTTSTGRFLRVVLPYAPEALAGSETLDALAAVVQRIRAMLREVAQ